MPPQTLLSWAFLFFVVFLCELSCDDCCWLVFFLTSGLEICPVDEQFDKIKTPWLADDSVYVYFMFIRANLGGTEAWSSLNVNCQPFRSLRKCELQACECACACLSFQLAVSWSIRSNGFILLSEFLHRSLSELYFSPTCAFIRFYFIFVLCLMAEELARISVSVKKWRK